MTEDGDVVGVTVERVDIVLDPLQGEEYVLVSIVASCVMICVSLAKLISTEEAEDTKPVVDYNDYDFSLKDHVCAVVLDRSSVGEAATVNEDHDAFWGNALLWCVEIHEKAVL